MWAVVPAKSLSRAKRRLAPALPASRRRELAASMLEDVLTTLSRVHALAGVVVSTADVTVAHIARRCGATVMDDTERGQTEAVHVTLAALARAGVRSALVLSGDVPGISAGEAQTLLAAHSADTACRPGLTLVSDRHHDGTNAIVCNLPAPIAFAFGPGSLERHQRRAHEACVAVRVLQLPGIELDIDQPEDLALLVARYPRTRAAASLLRGAARGDGGVVQEARA